MQLPLGDQSNGMKTILDHSIANALSFCHRVILVTGYRGEELEQRYKEQPKIKLVHNPDFRSGLTSSVLTGLAHVSTNFTFITHGDLPFLPRETFSALWEARSEGPVFPVCTDKHGQRQQGHPVLLPASMIPVLLNANTLRPMKQLLADNCTHIPVISPEIIRDIDTPEAYYSVSGVSLDAL